MALRIPLFLFASARPGSFSATILLGPGEWKLEGELDHLKLHSSDREVVHDKLSGKFTLTQRERIRAEVLDSFPSVSLSAWVEKVNGA